MKENTHANIPAYTQDDFDSLIKKLHTLADEKYRTFHSKLIPGVNTKFLGVRVPILRKIAKEIAKQDFRGFIKYASTSDIYEIIMLLGMVIGISKMEFSEKLTYLDAFVPMIDNWAVCDITVGDLKDIKNNLDTTFTYIDKWLTSDKEYELRFALVVLLDYYINDTYIKKVIDIYDNVTHDGYYVKMAVAWGLSICFIKQRDITLIYLTSDTKLDKFTFNKTIQKIRESYRVSPEDKAFLTTLKRK